MPAHQFRPRAFATITANGGMNAATTLIAIASPGENSRTTVHARMTSTRHVPIIARYTCSRVCCDNGER